MSSNLMICKGIYPLGYYILGSIDFIERYSLLYPRYYTLRHPQGYPWMWAATRSQIWEKSGGIKPSLTDIGTIIEYMMSFLIHCSGRKAPYTQSGTYQEIK